MVSGDGKWGILRVQLQGLGKKNKGRTSNRRKNWRPSYHPDFTIPLLGKDRQVFPASPLGRVYVGRVFGTVHSPTMFRTHSASFSRLTI